ncbi:MAG TPA: gamma-glutamyl-gamma-aminobutyrate hydrolase family protein [Tenuifilaceae bacterium]|nr:gamma-glutamyl-gamma-aminobutyrate hydrolase family protein [Tenuifilaceae bacterium]
MATAFQPNIYVMKKSLFLVMCAFILFSCENTSHGVFIKPDGIKGEGKVLVITHPTVSNLKTFSYLIDSGVISLNGNYRVVGIFSDRENYDYSLSEKFIKDSSLTHFFLLPVRTPLSIDGVYKENACTAEFKQIFDASDGIIFTGGPDIPPSLYGDKMLLLTNVTDPYRHYMEVSLLFHLIGGEKDSLFHPFLSNRPDYPVLGICLGMQSMNVAAGGTLFQDIPSEVYGIKDVESELAFNPEAQHRNYNCNYALNNDLVWGSFHHVNFTSPFFQKIAGGSNPMVLSSHHQAIRKLGEGYVAAGYSVDGKIIEAIKHAKYSCVIGVQFHPEPSLLYQKDAKILFAPNLPAQKSYVEICGDSTGINFHKKFWRKFSEMVNK